MLTLFGVVPGIKHAMAGRDPPDGLARASPKRAPAAEALCMATGGSAAYFLIHCPEGDWIYSPAGVFSMAFWPASRSTAERLVPLLCAMFW